MSMHKTASQFRNSGIGLRMPWVEEILHTQPQLGFLEIHAENYFGTGHSYDALMQLRAHYPISIHGVGLSLGRADALEVDHLEALATLVDKIDPLFISEHLSWSAYGDTHVPDLLPLPFTQDALDIISTHIDRVQNRLGRQILVENPSAYLCFAHNDFTETEFLNALVRQTGCGLLLDVNNIAVSAHNMGYDARAYIDALPPKGIIQEMHLAGYHINTLDDGTTIRIDTHNQMVHDDVWTLYHHALNHCGDTPTLIEWDSDFPPLSVLLAEADKADTYRQAYRKKAYRKKVHYVA